ncbi:hypothetical protein E2C01_058655 [Portunus trituberculatus]|uniref:DUF7041 domain-containing protein n=1 Tax=Portunus trituberculatus TaxID=210409 RepID=A0A5B7H613_PORTR|nr:hypothetical protein [Portunus trituberculatus]
MPAAVPNPSYSSLAPSAKKPCLRQGVCRVEGEDWEKNALRRLLRLPPPPRTLLRPRCPSGCPIPPRLPDPACGTPCRPMDYSPHHTATWIYSAVFSAVYSDFLAAPVVPVLAKSAFTMNPPDSGTAMALTFRAPPFCSQDPSLWFSLLECSFKVSKITSSLTKFNHAVSHLPPEVLL